jgi:hypothetical protein
MRAVPGTQNYFYMFVKPKKTCARHTKFARFLGVKIIFICVSSHPKKHARFLGFKSIFNMFVSPKKKARDTRNARGSWESKLF